MQHLVDRQEHVETWTWNVELEKEHLGRSMTRAKAPYAGERRSAARTDSYTPKHAQCVNRDLASEVRID
jgi:hypothetical protein